MSLEADELYQFLLNYIDHHELESEIRRKSEEYKGFMNYKGILFLIAKERGLNYPYNNQENIQEADMDYDDFAIDISELRDGMRSVVIIGRIKKIFGVRNFYRKEGTIGLIGAFVIEDYSSSIKIVLWDDQVKIMENEFFRINEIIYIINGFCKTGRNNSLEVHLSRKGKIILAPKDFNAKRVPPINIQQNDNFNILSIKEILNKEGFIKTVKGRIINFLPVKDVFINGERSFLISLILSDIEDPSYSIILKLWGFDGIELLKQVEEDNILIISDCMIKFNSFSGQKELFFTRKTRYEII
ncbi:MAG: hypothetical protein ACTSQP_14090 [Promethearchaeota archaeon]